MERDWRQPTASRTFSVYANTFGEFAVLDADGDGDGDQNGVGMSTSDRPKYRTASEIQAV